MSNIFRVIDQRKGHEGIFMIQAFDMNAARRKTKAVLGFGKMRLPRKKIQVMQVSNEEIQAMIQAQMQTLQEKKEAEGEATVTPIEAAEQAVEKLEELQARSEVLQAEAKALTVELSQAATV
jgi:hypothetical protein